MAFLRKVFGGDKKPAQAEAPAASGPLVSPNRYWRCPACGGVQGKRELDAVFKIGAPLPEAAPVPCSKCGRQHASADVYGGVFDFTGEAEVLTRTQIAQRYLEAEMTQAADALEALLAPDAVHTSMRGETAGAKAIADRLRNPQGMGAGMMGRLQWSQPVERDGKVVFEGKPTMPNAPFPGITMTLTFDEANKITRIEMGRREA